MPWISIVISEDYPKAVPGVSSLSKLSKRDFQLPLGDFVQRITAPLTAHLLHRIPTSAEAKQWEEAHK